MKVGENLLEVDLQNLEESSRWYPGAGIYRPVKLVLTGNSYIDPWKTFFRTTEIKNGEAILDVTVGACDVDEQNSFDIEISDSKGNVVAKQTGVNLTSTGEENIRLTINNPMAWTPETPYLYNAKIKLYSLGDLVDEVTQKIGIRTVKCSKDGGFQLNGVTVHLVPPSIKQRLSDR